MAKVLSEFLVASLLLLVAIWLHSSVSAALEKRASATDSTASPSLPTLLCPQGTKYYVDCNSCFCNPKSGLTGCTAISCPLNITAFPFPWAQLIPKFKLPPGSPPITLSSTVKRKRQLAAPSTFAQKI